MKQAEASGTPDGTAARGGLGTVRNAVQLLELLSEGPAYQQLTDLAERSGLSIPTVHRLLRSLVLADLVVQDPRSSRYGLGPELTRLSNHYLSRLPLLGALAPYLSQLRDQLGATIHVQTLVRGEVVYVDRVDGHDRGPYRDTHRVHPALESAGGRLLVARADDEQWRRAVAAAVEPEVAEEAEASRAAWAVADHLALTPADPTLPAEVAVPVVDGAGVTVAALSANEDSVDDAARVKVVAAHLGRAARAAGRTLGHA
ncbi:IclR family acetate operon transcriptional repressor [Ornithinimicrobium humiphilum]|uniref:IclR family acetate operon transcriptional repressor n=1 Tax=Ornithinimicrobium humiphilum TaxID=125288 RepID=A0A543K870_9MICO|nr:helix-turn-helix domain-containing protein [Ornithinimicrobium humiphilum]TQM91289.1 IclR family acetate operon transcriptional repressor [Ornithinimicrobium humiphilum]